MTAPKLFARSLNSPVALITAYKEMVEWIPIIEHVHVQECRYPKDDKFLELAVNGKAEYIITGDKDSLILNPLRGTQILTAKDFITSMFA